MTTLSQAATWDHEAASRSYALTLLSGSAGIIHLSVAPEHFAAWWGFGTFFVVVGVCQLWSGWALLRRPSEAVVLGTLLGNIGVILVYVASRTVGVPIGPDHVGHQLEPTGVLDLAATAMEVGVVTMLSSCLSSRLRHLIVNAVLLIGGSLWVLRGADRLG